MDKYICFAQAFKQVYASLDYESEGTSDFIYVSPGKVMAIFAQNLGDSSFTFNVYRDGPLTLVFDGSVRGKTNETF